MNLTGSRATLIANVRALIVASCVIAEGAYIVHERLGVFRPSDYFATFVPAFVMFIIRSRTFSFWFLFLYCAVAIEFFFKARSIYLGTYHYPGEKYPLQYMGMFFVFSIGCLAVYAAGALVRTFIRLIAKANRQDAHIWCCWIGSSR